jgi:hypothetical protein
MKSSIDYKTEDRKLQSESADVAELNLHDLGKSTQTDLACSVSTVLAAAE